MAPVLHAAHSCAKPCSPFPAEDDRSIASRGEEEGVLGKKTRDQTLQTPERFSPSALLPSFFSPPAFLHKRSRAPPIGRRTHFTKRRKAEEERKAGSPSGEREKRPSARASQRGSRQAGGRAGWQASEWSCLRGGRRAFSSTFASFPLRAAEAAATAGCSQAPAPRLASSAWCTGRPRRGGSSRPATVPFLFFFSGRPLATPCRRRGQHKRRPSSRSLHAAPLSQLFFLGLCRVGQPGSAAPSEKSGSSGSPAALPHGDPRVSQRHGQGQEHGDVSAGDRGRRSGGEGVAARRSGKGPRSASGAQLPSPLPPPGSRGGIGAPQPRPERQAGPAGAKLLFFSRSSLSGCENNGEEEEGREGGMVCREGLQVRLELSRLARRRGGGTRPAGPSSPAPRLRDALRYPGALLADSPLKDVVCPEGSAGSVKTSAETGGGMRRSPDVSPRRLSDISPQLRQLKYLVVDEAIKEDMKWRSVEDLTSASVGLTSIEERILRITGYYGYQPWATSYKSKCLVSAFLLHSSIHHSLSLSLQLSVSSLS
ncbi:putative thiamine transporter SLC35F3 [Crotalus adamanteus]|uniref:Thiamine transporter SLC35F3 n=1 Tax=Crotalus adamanteus TaxID=8729 RepID=A0AAW1CBW7_CROAD